ncbi:hypothetical protein BDV32DRAFT_74404 [Aspergillus pseudonomiae]|nr:hypothetical protein BDV32DRAFT_74404 [Aspergillus pseudonomiae]
MDMDRQRPLPDSRSGQLRRPQQGVPLISALHPKIPPPTISLSCVLINVHFSHPPASFAICPEGIPVCLLPTAFPGPAIQ